MDYYSLVLPQKNTALFEQTQRYFIKKHVIEALEKALEKPTHAALILQKYFRHTRALGSKDRRRVADIVYGIIRCSDIFSALDYQTPSQWFSLYQKCIEGFQCPYEENRNTIDAFSICVGIPKNVCSKIYDRFPTERTDFICWTHQLSSTYIRVCLDKIDRHQLQAELQQDNICTKIISSVPTTLEIQGPANLIAHPLYKKGYFEIQDVSSQRFCAHFDVNNKKIFDVCAGAGGKSLAFASQGAFVYAQDIRSHALQELQKRAQRNNYTIHQKNCPDPDIIVIDAPCSGTGRLSREPTLRWKYKEWSPLSFVATQQELIQTYQKRITKTHQRLVYATCSLLEEENNHEIAELQKTEQHWNWPHQNIGDGFFWATYQLS